MTPEDKRQMIEAANKRLQKKLAVIDRIIKLAAIPGYDEDIDWKAITMTLMSELALDE